MLVCQRFRDVAVLTPALWNTLDYAHFSAKWLKLCIERSGQSLMYVRDPYGQSIEHFPRLKVAWFELALFDVAEDGIFDIPAPFLDTLKLVGSARDPKKRININSSLIGGSNSSLVHVVLRHVAVNQLPLLPCLRQLELSNCLIHDGMDFLSKVANQVPAVEILFIQHLDHNLLLPPDHICTSGPATLPNLDVLFIQDVTSYTSSYMRSLPLPRSALGLRCYDPGQARQPFQRHHSNVYQAWQAFAAAHSSALEHTRGQVAWEGSNFSIAVHFGSTPLADPEQFGPESKSFCSFSGSSISVHNMLDDVDTFCVLRDPNHSYGPDFHLVDDIHRLRLLTNLRVLILDGLTESDYHSEWLGAFENWLDNNQDRVQQVVFRGCHQAFREYAGNLRHAAIAGAQPQVSWWD
jgi:hypothetical protein